LDREAIRASTQKLLGKLEREETFQEGLRVLLHSYAKEEAASQYRRIIPDAGRCFGVPFPILREIAAEMGRYLKRNPEEARQLLEALWREGSFEAQQIAGKALERFGPRHPEVALEFVSSVLGDLNNWAVCDNLAMFGVEPIVIADPQLVLPLIERWIDSPEKWIRRFAVAALRGYKRIQPTEQVFRLLSGVMEDPDRDVRRAVEWVLREISKKHPSAVAAFLRRYAQTHPSKRARSTIKQSMKKLSESEQAEILSILGEQHL